MKQENKYWQYGDEWTKTLPLRWPPAKKLSTFLGLSAILFSLFGAQLVTIFGYVIGVPNTGGNKGGDPTNIYYSFFPICYIVWMWRYTAPLSLWRYLKDSHNRPTLTPSQQWGASLITLVLTSISFAIFYFLLIPSQYK